MSERILVTFEGPFGGQMHLMQGEGDHVFLVDGTDKSSNGDPRTILFSVQAMRDFISEVDGNDN